MITFTVAGDPVAQPRQRVTARHGFVRTYLPSEHSIHGYKLRVAAAARQVFRRPLEGPVSLRIVFEFARPPSHWVKRGRAKGSPDFPGKPDWDNLAKAVADALNKLAYHDDAQIVQANVEKCYISDRVVHGRTTITIGSIDAGGVEEPSETGQ